MNRHRPMPLALLMCGALALLPAAPPLLAGVEMEVPDLEGFWQLEAAVTLPQGEAIGGLSARGNGPGSCVFEGSVQLDQDGDQVSGPTEMQYVSGPGACPAEMFGDLDATIEVGNQVFIGGGIDGPLGVLSLNGTIATNPGGTGTLQVTQGNFSDASGTWTASFVSRFPPVLAVPTLTATGLIVLTLAILAVGALILRNSA